MILKPCMRRDSPCHLDVMLRFYSGVSVGENIETSKGETSK